MHRVAIHEYVNQVCSGLNLPTETLAMIREELLAHAADSLQDKTEQGMSDTHAENETLQEMGNPAELGQHYRQTYRREHIFRLLARLTGLLAFFVMLIGVCKMSGMRLSVPALCDSSAIWILGAGTALLLGTFRFRTIRAALAAPFKLDASSEPGNPAIAAHVLRTWAIYMIGCGLLALTFGTILICLRLSDVNTVGPALALAVLGMLYAMLAAGVLWSLAGSLPASNISDPDTLRTHAAHPVAKLLALPTFGIILAIAAYDRGFTAADLSAIADIPSLILVTLGVIALAVASYGPKGTLLTLASLFHRTNTEAITRPRLRMIGIYSVTVGVVGFFLGGVIILAKLNEFAQLPPAIAVALLTLLYGLTFGLITWMLAGPALPTPGEPRRAF